MLKLSDFSRSVAWVSSSLALAQGLRLIQAVVIARWLGPEEMGLSAYVYSILMLVDLLRAIGAEQVYIARSPSEPQAEKAWLAGCWNARLLLACLVGLLMFVGGLGVSHIGEERLGLLLMLLSLLSPLVALRSAELIHQQKVQNFGPLSRFEVVVAVLQSLLPLAVVHFYRSVEALVFANLLAMLIAAAFSHLVFPMRFSFRLPSAVREELIFYGKNNIATAMLTTLHTNLDNFAVGSFIGRASLGIYSTGYRLAMAPHMFIQPVAQRLLVPSYRKAADLDLRVLALRWQAGFRFLALGYTALAGVTILLSDWGVALLFDPEWASMSYVLVFASFIVFFRGMAVTISPLLVILRAPHMDARFKTMEVGAFAIFVAAGAARGSLDIILAGGVVSYLLAFWLRWRWWRAQLNKAALTEISSKEFLYPGVGLVILLLATLLRAMGIYPLLCAASLCLLLVLPTLVAGRNVLNRFEERAA